MHHLSPQVIDGNASPHLQKEDGAEHPGKCESHTVTLVDSTTTSEEGHNKYDETKEYQEDRGGEVMSKEVKILTVR